MNHFVVKKSLIFHNSIGRFLGVCDDLFFLAIYNFDEAQVGASHHNGYHSALLKQPSKIYKISLFPSSSTPFDASYNVKLQADEIDTVFSLSLLQFERIHTVQYMCLTCLIETE